MKLYQKGTIQRKGLINILKLTKTSEPTETTTSVGSKLNGYGIFELTRPTLTQPPSFALQIKGKPLAFVKEVQDVNQHRIYKPPRKVPWTLPTEPQECGLQTDLWKEVEQCIYDHIDLPEPEAYTVLTAWVFASWLLEKWTIAPYLFFYGALSTGKTRALEVLSKLSMRGWLALYVTPPSLYRPIESWKPSVFLDEAEIYGDKSEILGLLNGSYRRGQFVARLVEKEEGYETEFFDCFSFKGIAGTRSLAKTLQSRCIIFRMSQATRKIKFFVDEKQCTQLRNKLLKWRFNTLLGEDTERSEGTEAFAERGEQLTEEIGSQREVELFYPLILVAPTEQIQKTLIEYAKTCSKQKMDELSLSVETICLSAIIETVRRNRIKNGKIFIQDITEIINEVLSINEYWKERFTGSVCSRLGFQKSRGSHGKAVIIWSEKLMERLKKDRRYASCFAPSETTSSSETPSESSEPSSEKPLPVSPEPKEDWLKKAKDVKP